MDSDVKQEVEPKGRAEGLKYKKIQSKSCEELSNIRLKTEQITVCSGIKLLFI